MNYKIIFPSLVALALCATHLGEAAAATPAGAAQTVIVELTDTSGTTVQRRAYTVRVANTEQTATLKVQTRQGSLKMTVRVRRRSAKEAVVSFGLDRHQRSKGIDDRVVLHLDSRVAIGKRADVAIIPRGKKTSLGVALTVR